MNPGIESLESRIAPAALLGGSSKIWPPRAIEVPASVLSVTLDDGLLSIKGSPPASGIQARYPFPYDFYGQDSQTFVVSLFPADNLILNLSQIGEDALFSILNTGGKVKFGGSELTELKLTKAQMDSVKSIEIDLGDGSNSTVFTSDEGTALSDPIKYIGGSGADTLTFGSDTKAFATTGNFTALLKAGNDRVIFTHNAQFGGNTLLNLGQGDDSLLTEAAALDTGSALSFKNLSILGGDGNDSLALGLKTTNNKNLSVSGALRIDGGKGANDVGLFGNNVSLGNTTIKSSAQDKDFDVSIAAAQKLEVNGSLSVTASGAETGQTNEFTMDAARIKVSGNVSYRGGTGADTVALGTQTTSLETFVGGALSVKNNGGDNSTTIGHADATLALGGNLSVTGANQTDNLSIQAASGVIAGGVSAELGKGANSVDISSDGQLNVAKLRMSSASVTEADSLNLRGVNLHGHLRASLGAGVSTVTIAQVIAQGTVSVQTRAGNDIVNVETDGGTGTSTFYKTVAIDTGVGADKTQVGTDSTENEAVFLGKLSIKAGPKDLQDELQGIKLTDANKLNESLTALLASNTFLTGAKPLLSRAAR